MQLFGYDRDKQLTKVSMTPAQIVEAGIDPFRLDLFDENPVRLTTRELHARGIGAAEADLCFARLMKISFAYAEDQTGYIGIFDGTKGYCVSGAVNYIKTVGVALNEPKPTVKSFEFHWHRYLDLAFDTRAKGVTFFRGSNMMSRSWHCGSGDNVVYNKGAIAYIDPTSSTTSEGLVTPNVNFTGRMYEPITANAELPATINWVFDAFRNWTVRVSGPGLIEGMAGKTPRVVQVFMQLERPTDQQDVCRYLKTLGLESLLLPAASNAPRFNYASFVRGETMYNITFETPRQARRYPRAYRLTALHLAATAANTVVTSRIGMHDMAHKLLRYDVDCSKPDDTPNHESLSLFETMLSLAGFRAVRTALVNTVENNWQ